MNAHVGRLAAALASLCIGIGGARVQAQPLQCSGAPTSTRLIIDVEGVRSDRGFVVGTLYGPDKRRFLRKHGWLLVWRTPARRGQTVLCTYLPAPGYYAAVIYQDADDNGVLDQGLFGFPLEGYGFSNNARPFLGPPSLRSAKFFARQGDTVLHVRLRYP
ncbi:MAG TPA: DUF2141 domain-containing protein [Caulobacteraceae bacterium]|nr:DUF2141 domain-containing protein [Caulobacteraceae bacterium]